MKDAPEPRIWVRNFCSSASQAHTLCDKTHQNVSWSLSSTHNLALGKRIQAKPSLEFTWTIPMTAGSIQTLPSPSSSQILAILFKLDTSFPLPSSPRHPRTAEQNIPSRDRVGRTTCERQNCTEAGSCVISIHQPNHKSQVEMDQVFSLLETEVGRKTVSLSSHCLSLAPEHKIQFQTPCYRMPKSPQCHERNGT